VSMGTIVCLIGGATSGLQMALGLELVHARFSGTASALCVYDLTDPEGVSAAG
jgi:hypothetical protein